MIRTAAVIIEYTSVAVGITIPRPCVPVTAPEAGHIGIGNAYDLTLCISRIRSVDAIRLAKTDIEGDRIPIRNLNALKALGRIVVIELKREADTDDTANDAADSISAVIALRC